MGAIFVLSASVIAWAGCESDACGDNAWTRFVASLEQIGVAKCPLSPVEELSRPETQPQAIASTPGEGSCAPHAGDGACTACIRAACCAEMSACLNESRCACLATCRAGGESAESCASAEACDVAPDARYAAALGCIAERCATECPELR
jgi:hypothetical protein